MPLRPPATLTHSRAGSYSRPLSRLTRSAAAGASVLAVADLVGGLGDDGGDAARAQLLAVRPRGVRLVPEQRVRCGPRPPGPAPGNP